MSLGMFLSDYAASHDLTSWRFRVEQAVSDYSWHFVASMSFLKFLSPPKAGMLRHTYTTRSQRRSHSRWLCWSPRSHRLLERDSMMVMSLLRGECLGNNHMCIARYFTLGDTERGYWLRSESSLRSPDD